MTTLKNINYRQLLKGLLILGFLMKFTNLYAQSNKDSDRQTTITITDYVPSPLPPDSIRVYTKVDTMPKFRGDINKYFRDSIRYPKGAKEKKIQCTVFVSFIIERDGSISDVKILRSPNNSLSTEAIRVVSTMPKWTPGKQNRKVVRVQWMVPIHFTLPPASGGVMEK